MTVQLHGYQYSVYAWIARLAMHEKGIGYKWVEVNPFAKDVPTEYLAMHPFGRVPTLVNGDFVLFETGAITGYIDEAFQGPPLQPIKPEDRGRVSQIISVIDSYGYWPLVRQVFSHGVFRPRLGHPADPMEYQRGLESAPRVLAALDQLAKGGDFLVADTLSLADIHLAPMVAYFTSDPNGEALLRQYDRLSAWWSVMSLEKHFVETKPELPEALNAGAQQRLEGN
jgi:glutathione S-transferase